MPQPLNFSLFLLPLLMFVHASVALNAAESESVEEFTNSYLVAIERWKSKYSKVSSAFSLTQDRKLNRKLTKLRQEIEVFIDGSKQLSSSKSDFTTDVNCATERGFFSLSKPSEGIDFSVVGFGRPIDVEASKAFKFRMARSSVGYVCAAFHVMPGETLFDELEWGSIQTVSKTSTEKGPGLEVKLDFNSGNYQSMVVVLSPDHDFAIQRVRTDFKRAEGVSEEFVESIVSYEDGPDGSWVPNEVRTRLRTVSLQANETVIVDNESVVKIGFILFSRPPSEVFTAEHYGIPDLFDTTTNYYPFDRFYFWLLLTGVVGSSYFIARSRRRNVR